MFLWFAGLSVLIVWKVFQSNALDYRFVMLGAVLPTVEVVFGGPRVLHTLLGSVVALVAVMLLTQNKRILRRRLLGVPIGLFMHLVLDGSWADTQAFWWPAFGWSFGRGELPEIGRGIWSFVLELAGAAALAFAWHRFGLADPRRRTRFLRQGRVDSELVP